MALPFSPLISRQTPPPQNHVVLPPPPLPFNSSSTHTQSFGFHSPKSTTFPFCYIFPYLRSVKLKFDMWVGAFLFSFSLSLAAAVFFSGKNGAWGKRLDFSSCSMCALPFSQPLFVSPQLPFLLFSSADHLGAAFRRATRRSPVVKPLLES